MDNETSDIVVLKFADAKVPVFKEVRNKDWILYGEDNLYPEYLIYLYNKSSKHEAIINGKSDYIFGSGFKSKSNQADDFKLPRINRYGENWNTIMPKFVKDIEIHGGGRLFVIWGMNGRIADIIHCEFHHLRTAKDGGGFWYKEDWENKREEAVFYPEFNMNSKDGCQVYAYNEYRPGSKVYPLPNYLACNNYIETDIEISKFHLSSIKNGMMPSKMIEFFTGEPTDEKKKEIERRWGKKFAGSENAGKFVLVFNSTKDKAVNIQDLSANELDKQFTILNDTCQQEIFTGHRVTSPMLFGIKEAGQLGGNNELKTAYEIFINTYAKPKQANMELMVNFFNGQMGIPADYYIEQLDPIGFQFTLDSLINILPKEFIFEKLNVPKQYWALPSAGTDPAKTPQAPGGQGLETDTNQVPTNDNLKNMTAKQHQQLLRIIRQYSKGQITLQAATIMLKTGLGLSDEDIKGLLGIEEDLTDGEQFSADISDDDILQMFSEVGEAKDSFHIVKTKKVKFSTDEEAFETEMQFYKQAFRGKGQQVKDADILDLIKKDKLITPEDIAKSLRSDEDSITSKIADMVKRGLIEVTHVYVGDDVQTERTLTDSAGSIDDLPPASDGVTEILIKYSYEGPKDSRNRPFCAKMMELDRLYSRGEIESISQRLGYSVFDRRGGFWRHKGTDLTTPYCRHEWKQNILVRKGGKAS